MNTKARLKSYQYDILNLGILEISPFEIIDTFHVRDQLMEDFELLDIEDKTSLLECDKNLLERASEVYQHLNPIFDWENNHHSLAQWWWHLDKVHFRKLVVDLVNGTINFEKEIFIDVQTQKDNSLEKFYDLAKKVNFSNFTSMVSFSDDIKLNFQKWHFKESNFIQFTEEIVEEILLDNILEITLSDLKFEDSLFPIDERSSQRNLCEKVA